MKIQSVNDFLTQAWCKLVAFSRDEKGASGIEYVLIAVMVAIVIALFTTGMGTQIKAELNKVLEALGGTAVS
ncbi:Flp family type IVb pilin [Vibrio sp.]|uniref:Flp family type IVb pilin n=1 Tax=Vibrio sp. TaxID=678 RepID=UPI003AA93563